YLDIGLEYVRERIIELVKSGYIEVVGIPDLRERLIELEKRLSQTEDEGEKKILEEKYSFLENSITLDSEIQLSGNGKKVIQEVLS
ncbi:MAG: hypothetical protein RMI88_07755, partial [Nitrososphaerota archaeon]|nr:hypothetical protein [Nitrososphaerota archaeon]